jgi:hypothetical protein
LIYHLRIITWVGVSFGASHYTGTIDANYRVKEDVPTVRLDNRDMFSEAGVIRAARRWFKKNGKRGDILLKGSHCYCDPLPVLIGPREFKTKGNALYKRAQSLDFWEHSRNDPKMEKIAKAWDKLCGDFE